MKIDKTQLTQKEKETFDKIQRAIKKDKKKGEEFLERFTKMLQKKKSKAVKSSETKKTTKTPKTPQSTSTTSGATQLLQKQSKDIARIEKELGVSKKEATRIAKSKRKNTKGKSESVSSLIARFKKQFAIPPNAQRDFKKDGKIPAKTAVKRKSPTYGKKGGAKKPFYYEYRMNRRDNSNVPVYLEEGGEDLNIITFDNKASRDEFLKEMNFIAPDNSLVILDDVSIQNMGAKSDVDFYNERAKSFNGEFYAKGGELKGMKKIRLKKSFSDKYMPSVTHIYFDKSNDKYYFLDFEGDVMELKNEYTLEQLKNEGIIPMAKGGKIGFEALSDKVAKRYEGKKVPSKFRDEYGEKYDKEEAKEVGDKVAAKVYRQQQAKMEHGGEPRHKKPYIATILMENGGKLGDGYYVSWFEDGQEQVEIFDSNELEEAKNFFNQIKREKFYYEKPKVVMTSIRNGKVIMGEKFDKGGEFMKPDNTDQLYDRYYFSYPFGTDAVAYILFDSAKDDNVVANAIRNNQNLFDKVEDIVLEYKDDLYRNMEYIDEEIEELIEDGTTLDISEGDKIRTFDGQTFYVQNPDYSDLYMYVTKEKDDDFGYTLEKSMVKEILMAKGGKIDEYKYFEVTKTTKDGNTDTTYERINVSSPTPPNSKEITKKEYDKNVKFAKGGDIKALKSISDDLEKGSKLHKKQSEELANASASHKIQSKILNTIAKDLESKKIEFEHGGSTDIANTILQQMGGIGRLRMFTGAKNFVALPNGV